MNRVNTTMTQPDTTPPSERELRRQEFATIVAGMPGTLPEKIKKICDVLGYKPHTIRVLLCRKNPWKVIPAAKLHILKRELAREATTAA